MLSLTWSVPMFSSPTIYRLHCIISKSTVNQCQPSALELIFQYRIELRCNVILSIQLTQVKSRGVFVLIKANTIIFEFLTKIRISLALS